ncbi:MAG: hypothetical protein K6E62_10815 [Lachnospiraceae bacterium]|nr:hypothetical protein [Lachnospiraceae bacterium]
MSYTDPEYADEYREQMLCDGLTEENLENAGYSNGFDLLDDEMDSNGSIFEDGFDQEDNSDWL